MDNMTNEKPNYRIKESHSDSEEYRILISSFLRGSKENLEDKTFWGCNPQCRCNPYEEERSCDPQCSCAGNCECENVCDCVSLDRRREAEEERDRNCSCQPYDSCSACISMYGLHCAPDYDT